jgi:hypothetical protein
MALNDAKSGVVVLSKSAWQIVLEKRIAQGATQR